jgi:RNA polymerase-binding transcription factor DksA
MYQGQVDEQQDVAEILATERTSTLSRLGGLERELSGIIESGSAGADDEHDPEGATLAFERQHTAALLGQARQHLAETDAALARLAEGSYGTCANCGEQISGARLAALPVTTTCIRCASRR